MIFFSCNCRRSRRWLQGSGEEMLKVCIIQLLWQFFFFFKHNQLHACSILSIQHITHSLPRYDNRPNCVHCLDNLADIVPLESMLPWVEFAPKHASATEIGLRILAICTLMLKSSCMHQYLMSNKDVSTLQYFWAGAAGIMSTVFTQPHPWFIYCQDLRSHCFTPRRFVEPVCGKKTHKLGFRMESTV